MTLEQARSPTKFMNEAFIIRFRGYFETLNLQHRKKIILINAGKVTHNNKAARLGEYGEELLIRFRVVNSISNY